MSETRSQPNRRMARPLGERRWPMARPLREEQPGDTDVHWSSRAGHWSERQHAQRSPRQLVGPAVLLLIGAATVAGVVGLPGGAPAPISARPSPSASPGSIAQVSASPEPRPSTPPTAQPAPSGNSSTIATPRPAPTATTASSPTPALTPTPAPTPPPPPASPTPRPRDWAAQSAAAFDRDGEVIDIEFPLRPGSRYQYRDNWGRLRDGAPEPYNHLHQRRRAEPRRAHDGIDIYARPDSPVVAPFAGTVIDPATRWQPWRPERYGQVVVIVSNEPQSGGYAALLAHLDIAFVEPGTVVRRGEVVGLAGISGNAEDSRVHLHFELRAPFLIGWPEPGGERLVDAFNPFRSLVDADPRR